MKKLLVTIMLSTILVACSNKNILTTPAPLPEIAIQSDFVIEFKTNIGASKTTLDSNLSPTIFNNVIYTADSKGTITAVDSLNGKIIWSINLSEVADDKKVTLAAGITLAEGNLYVVSENYKLYALSQNDGSLKWAVDTLGGVVTPPVYANGKIFIKTNNSWVSAYASQTGQHLWDNLFDTHNQKIRGSKAIFSYRNSLVFGTETGSLTAIEQKNGNLEFILPLVGAVNAQSSFKDIIAETIVVGDTLYTASYAYKLLAFNLKNKQTIWENIEIDMIRDISYIDNKLIVVTARDVVYALDSANGAILWKQDSLLNREVTNAVKHKNNIVVVDFEGYAHSLDIHGGELVAQQRIDSAAFYNNAQIIDNKILLQAKNGVLYLVN